MDLKSYKVGIEGFGSDMNLSFSQFRRGGKDYYICFRERITGEDFYFGIDEVKERLKSLDNLKYKVNSPIVNILSLEIAKIPTIKSYYKFMVERFNKFKSETEAILKLGEEGAYIED